VHSLTAYFIDGWLMAQKNNHVLINHCSVMEMTSVRSVCGGSKGLMHGFSGSGRGLSPRELK
jgi:hypothetical protein